MVSSAPNSPGGAAARSRRDAGSNLLHELEALSQALYKASQAQNVGNADGPGSGSSFRKDPGSSQRRETLPLRPTSDVFSKPPPVVGNPSRGGHRKPPQVRHSMSGPPAPLYEDEGQEEPWKQPRQARHSMATPRPAPVFEHHEEELPQQRPERKLQPWHSQGYEKNLPEVTNFPEWLEDNINFSKKLETPAEKKKSIWNWKPFRTLSHIGHTRYNCLFTVHVHAIEGLPQAMNGLRLTVHWRHKDRAVQTMPSRVFHSSAEFEETLQLRCSVYGSKSAHHAVKFMPKAFTLCVIALDVDALMLGQHHLDLTRLLPETPDHEYEDDDKPLSWTTSFKLTGKAKGGTLVVTFGYELLNKEKGDKSGRFGSTNGYPSPSLSSPSLRSFGGGSHSTHGTPRPRPSDGNSFFSPTLSEPGDYNDYMGMEHLNLDESSSASHGNPHSHFRDNSRGSRSQTVHGPGQKVKGFPYDDVKTKRFDDAKLKRFGLSQGESTLAPLTPRQTQQPAEATTNAFTLDRSVRDTYGDSDEEQEFIVVDQGVEVGTLPENFHYPKHNFEEQSVTRESLRREAKKEAEHLHGDELVRGNRPEGNVLLAPEDDKEVFENVEDTAGTPETVASVEEDLTELREYEEEGRFEDAVEEVKFFDPLGKLQRATEGKRKEEASKETQRRVPVGRYQEEEEKEVNQQPKFWSPSGGHQEYRSAEAAQETVYWESPSSPPTREEIREWDPVTKYEEERFEVTQGQIIWDQTEKQQEQARFQVTQESDLWDQPGRPQEYSTQETSQETVVWETTPSPSAHEEIGEVHEGQMWGNVNPLGPLATAGNVDDQNHSAIDDLDDEVDLIAGDFLSMLDTGEKEVIMATSSDSEIDSPRAILLRQFEQEALLEGGVELRLGTTEIPELNLDEVSEGTRGCVGDSDALALGWQSEEDTELASIMEAAESELQKATQMMRSKTRAKMLEDAETEALMQEWGLNERAFENSPPKPAEGFLDTIGSQMAKVPSEPPVLAQGVGPVLQTKDGGMLRSMSPALFSQSSASGKLVMQVSKPVVVPSEMGSSGLDIFRRLASGGVENMALQAMVAMPLEDITGKSVHQIAYESKAALEGPSYNHNYLPSNGYNTALSVGDTGRHRNHGAGLVPRSRSSGVARRPSPADPSDEFVSLEELAPMAMQKIEALAMDGLKIQADMTEESAPYCVDPLPWGDAGPLESSKFRKGGIGSLDGVAAMHLDARSFNEDVPTEAEGLMSKVISIDEWMRLDAGQYDENDTKEDTLAILAAHGAVNKDVVARGSKEDRIRYLQGAKASANFGKGGFMGNTLTIAMLVQLRDPLRNNEPVGAPMMALVQAERVIVPPRPKIPKRLPSLLGNSELWEDEEDSHIPEKPAQAQFKVTAVHMSGLKPSEEQTKEQSKEPITKKKTWGNQKQQQSGSRWLAANGMGRSAAAGSKLSALKNKHQPAQMTVKPGESLWSISARVHGTGSKWKEVAALNPHIRNPDVILANQKIRTR